MKKIYFSVNFPSVFKIFTEFFFIICYMSSLPYSKTLCIRKLISIEKWLHSTDYKKIADVPFPFIWTKFTKIATKFSADIIIFFFRNSLPRSALEILYLDLLSDFSLSLSFFFFFFFSSLSLPMARWSASFWRNWSSFNSSRRGDREFLSPLLNI